MSQENPSSTNNTFVQTDDLYSIYEQTTLKYFENVRKNYPQYFQALTNFQQECIKTFENAIYTMIKTQQNYAKQYSMNSTISTDAKNTISECTSQMIQASDINSKIRKTVLDTMTENLKVFNDSVKSFADVNKSAN